MNINPHDPAYPCSDRFKSFRLTGLPIRLELAARMMAGFAADTATNEGNVQIMAASAILWADALIAAYNEETK